MIVTVPPVLTIGRRPPPPTPPLPPAPPVGPGTAVAAAPAVAGVVAVEGAVDHRERAAGVRDPASFAARAAGAAASRRVLVAVSTCTAGAPAAGAVACDRRPLQRQRPGVVDTAAVAPGAAGAAGTAVRDRAGAEATEAAVSGACCWSPPSRSASASRRSGSLPRWRRHRHRRPCRSRRYSRRRPSAGQRQILDRDGRARARPSGGDRSDRAGADRRLALAGADDRKAGDGGRDHKLAHFCVIGSK